MSDAEPYAYLDDQHLVWQIPDELGREVARRWRRLNDEIERLKAENARLDRDRTRLLFWKVYRIYDGWYVRGVWFAAQPFATREEAMTRLIEHAHNFWDWASERRRRKEEGWPDGVV